MTTPKTSATLRLDRIAVFLSSLCLLHCLAFPVALLFAPLLSIWLDHNETDVHWLLLGLALPVSAIALWRGYLRHPSVLTVGLGALGLLLMLLAVTHWFGEDMEVTLTVLGVSALLYAHIRNMKNHEPHVQPDR